MAGNPWQSLGSALLQGNASNPTPLYTAANYSSLAFPGPAVYPFYSASQSNTCNVYVPNDSTLSRCVHTTMTLSCVHSSTQTCSCSSGSAAGTPTYQVSPPSAVTIHVMRSPFVPGHLVGIIAAATACTSHILLSL